MLPCSDYKHHNIVLLTFSILNASWKMIKNKKRLDIDTTINYFSIGFRFTKDVTSKLLPGLIIGI